MTCELKEQSFFAKQTDLKRFIEQINANHKSAHAPANN